MLPSLRSLALLALAGAGPLLFSGCYDDGPHYGRAAYYGHPAYADRDDYYYDRPRDYDRGYYADADYYDSGPDVDFYYVGGRPYSRAYGELVFRDGGYYYSHGGRYVVYDRGGRSRARGDRHSRTVVSNDYRVNNYNTTSARYRGGNTYATRGTYPGGTYPNGATGTYRSRTYAGAATTVRGAQPAATTTRTQVRTRPHARTEGDGTTTRTQ